MVQDGIVFKGERAVIPNVLRSDMIHRVHSAHLGIEGCLSRARVCLLAWNECTDKEIH